MSDAHITIDNVTKRFGEKRVHRGVSLTVRRGEVMTLAGGSGQGKSVLLKEIIGLMRPDSGRVLIGDDDVTAMSERALMPVRRRVGMLFQGAALFDHLSVYHNIAFPLRQHGETSEAAIAERVAETLAMVDLPGVADSMPEELSGGMRKRVGLARAIATQPEILLYDEPTTGLDPRTARRILDLIKKLQEELRVTSVMVTHDMPSVRAATDRMALLNEGRIAAVGTWDDMQQNDDPFVRAFLDETYD